MSDGTPIVFSLDQAGEVAMKLLDASAGKKIWLFSGEPGAGKTTLIKSITEKLGGDSSAVNSPTFAILNRYETSSGPVFHFDLYRTKSITELLDIGIIEYLDSGDYCFIEWPERLGSLKPKDCFEIILEHSSNTTRQLIIS